MKMRILACLIILFSGIATMTMAIAEDIMIGNLMLHDPWVKATIGNKPVTGGYLMIHNHGEDDDRLIAVEASFAGKSEIHEMNIVNDVMQMRPLPDGLVIPAGEHVMLKSGGYHLMFMKLKEPILADTNYPVTLVFQRAGRIEINIMAKDLKDMHKHTQ